MNAKVTIKGEGWFCSLTQAEYAAWDKYAETHPWLFALGYEAVLRMFLANLRNGCDLNACYERNLNKKAELRGG